MKIEMEHEEFNKIAQALGNYTKLIESKQSLFPPKYIEGIQMIRRKLLANIGSISAPPHPSDENPEKIDLNG